MPNKTSQRPAPLLPSEWDADIHDALEAFPSGRDFVLTAWKEGIVPGGAHGLGVMLHHPALAKAFLTFNNHVLMGNTLSKRHRELLILRTGWLRRSEYEFVQHVKLALREGISEAEIERVQEGPDADGWDPLEADLLRTADQLIANACIEEVTWNRLAEHFDTKQLLDIVYTVGTYEIVAMVFKTFAVPLEPTTTPLAPDVRARMHDQTRR
jgi:alkylhydroperoxidase family enzyme